MESHLKEKDKNLCKEIAKDPSLDIVSEAFDPLKALYAPDFQVTDKNPKVIYQNLAALETALKKNGILGLNKRPKDIQPNNSKQIVKTDDDQQICRRFQEYQMPIKTENKTKSRHQRNLIKQMEQAKGPLKQLNNYVVKQKRVCVVVRKEHGIRGYIKGVIQCFDRHWNLLLTEVEECYQQRKYNYVEQKLSLPLESKEDECLKRLSKLNIKWPTQMVKSLNRKNVEIKRQIPQLFLRGEQVVLIRNAEILTNENDRRIEM